MALGHDTLLQKTVLTGQPQSDGTDTTGLYWYMGLVDSKAARRASSAASRDSKAVSLARTASMLLIDLLPTPNVPPASHQGSRQNSSFHPRVSCQTSCTSCRTNTDSSLGVCPLRLR